MDLEKAFPAIKYTNILFKQLKFKQLQQTSVLDQLNRKR